MSNASSIRPPSEKGTQDVDEQESTMDNRMKNELLDEKERKRKDKNEGTERSELTSSSEEETVNSQVYTATSLPVMANETRNKTYPLVNALEHIFVLKKLLIKL